MTLGQAVLAARPLPGPGVVQLISESSNPHVRYAALLGAAVGDCGLVIALKAEFLVCSQAYLRNPVKGLHSNLFHKNGLRHA